MMADWDEELALYLLGALPPDEVRAVEERLERGWPEAEEFMRTHHEVVRALADVPPVEPPPTVKTRLMAMARETALPSISGVAMKFVFRNDDDFRATRYPGIKVRVLSIDRTARRMSLLMKLEAGSEYPAHHHDGYEECLILEGEIRVGSTRLCAGDYQRCETNTDHVEQYSPTGALLWLSAPLAVWN